MQEPAIPEDEEARLAALQALEVLDTPPEARFDRVTRIARDLFDVPIALVSLVDSDRQWFKSCQGLDATETPRSISFCGHAILGDDIFCVPDALEDPRFADNPLVTGPPEIRFYAGAPLKLENGRRVGTLCIIDRRPRSLDAVQRRHLRDLADWVQDELQLHALQSALQTVSEQEARLRIVLDNVLEAIITIDTGGIIQSVNPAACRMFGYRPEELVGERVNRLMPDEVAQAHDGYLERYLRTGEAHVIGQGRDVEGLHRDGTRLPLHLSVSETRVHGQRLFIGVLADIGERVRLARLKDEFVSTVSHELRTPLTSIRGALGLLAAGQAGSLPEQARPMVDIALRNSERLVRLIGDILDMQKIEAGNLVLEPVRQALAPRVAEVIDASQGYAGEFGVELHFEPPAESLQACIDADRFSQILTNLIGNAVKFSPRGGRVRVSLDATAGEVCVSVSDQGPGIPDAFRARLFDRFTQADAGSDRERGGTGLGLHIARVLTEAHGGHIEVESSEGEGTCFRVCLPRG